MAKEMLHEGQTITQQLNSQLEEFQDELLELTRNLPSLKGREKRLTKKSIRRLERAIRKQQRLIKKHLKEKRKAGQIETEQILAEQGIDSRGNIANTISSTVGGIVETGLTAFAPQPPNTQAPDLRGKKKDTKMLMYAGIGVGAIFLLMMLKKKK